MAGLFSDVKRENAETIAHLHHHDRQAVQKSITPGALEPPPAQNDGLVAASPRLGLTRSLDASSGLRRSSFVTDRS
jgi:hypothetical protein